MATMTETVSRVISGSRSVSPDVKERVLRVLRHPGRPPEVVLLRPRLKIRTAGTLIQTRMAISE